MILKARGYLSYARLYKCEKSKDNREKKLRVSLHLFNEKEIMKKANELALTFWAFIFLPLLRLEKVVKNVKELVFTF